ncbi:unnamed protein product [Didymodactylos carnosus]|uniref:Uncharacterized protein n=1 Tax=Didymodactylos carnosus TaxID=1234261 RepID=A0A813YW94_9BILA|nr:unnamed protein product [Didymodactylos carnosus]CAF3674507.1 unnamed protein product [Didymodactylos carnosus]
MGTIANVFRGSDQHSLSFHKLNNHKQRSDESVIEYYNTMIKLCNQTDPNMADTSKLNYLQMDLKQSLQNDVFRRHPSTAAQFFQVAQEEESLQTIVRTYAALTASVFIDPLKSKAEPEASISSVQCSPQKPSARPAPYHQNSSATKSYNPPHYSQLTNRTHTPKKASPRCFGCGKVLRHSPMHSSKSTAHLADQNKSLKILGEVKLNIRINDVTTPITALVVKSLNADFILGGNWCYDTGAIIEYDKQQVSIRSYYGRSSIRYDKQIDTLALDLKLLNSASIPPRESIVVQAKLDLSSAKFAYFHPDIDLQQPKCISMTSALLKIDKYSTFLEIYNPSEFSRTLYKNAVLGQVTYTPPNVASFDAFENLSSLNQTSPSVNSITQKSRQKKAKEDNKLQAKVETLFTNLKMPRDSRKKFVNRVL